MTESSSNITSFIAIGVGILAIAIGGYYTFFMGCNNSVAVDKSAPAQTARKAKKDEASEKPKYPNGPVSIFFGSQTGTAEGFARTLMNEGRKAGFDTKTCDLEEFDPEVLASTKLAIFLMATYGEGEPTDNAQKFMLWLKNEAGDVASDFLSNMKFVVFGLGNKQYEHFNRTGKMCNEGLSKFGGVPVYKYGEGDDDGTLEEDFDAWKTDLWSSLSGGSAAAASAKEETCEKVTLTYELVPAPQGSGKESEIRNVVSTRDALLAASSKKSSQSSKIPASLKHFFTSPRARVVVNRELRNQSYTLPNPSDRVGSTRHIEIDLAEVGLSYFTADNLAILPENSDEVVEAFAAHMGYALDEIVTFAGKENDFVAPYPSPCSVRELLTCFADIQGHLRHSMLKDLLAYVTDAQQLAWATRLAAHDHRAEFREVIEEGHHSLVSLTTPSSLEGGKGKEKEGLLSSLKIPLADLLHIVNPIQPRYYTIASSSSYHPDHVHITVSVTETVLANGQIFHGLCSRFLQSLEQEEDNNSGSETNGQSKKKKMMKNGQKYSARVFVRPSTFRLPKSLASPVIFVGPGTGLAPMRALLQERQFLIEQSSSSDSSETKPGESWLFFGCKHAGMDYIYREEIESFKTRGVLTQLFTAFSRDNNQENNNNSNKNNNGKNKGKKVYVQDLMTQDKERGAALARMLIEGGGSLYVCGATAMGADVMAAVEELLKEHLQMTGEAAHATVKKLQEKGRYVQELWTA